jgi:hypothetical protein
MRGTHVLGLVVVLGPRVTPITTRVLEQSQRKKLHHAQEITPQGRLASPGDFAGVISSASPLGTDGVIVRFCADDTERAVAYMKDLLAPLQELIGHTPYQENR